MLPPGNSKITLFIWELKPFLSHLELRSQKTKEVVMLTRVMVLVYQMVLEALLQTVSMTWHRCVKLEPRRDSDHLFVVQTSGPGSLGCFIYTVSMVGINGFAISFASSF